LVGQWGGAQNEKALHEDTNLYTCEKQPSMQHQTINRVETVK